VTVATSPATPAAGAAAGSTLVRVRGLEKVFTADGRALRAVAGVDLDIVSGEVHALVGESGSGKTTLARCILRLIEPTAGTIELDGRDIGRLRGGELRALRRGMQIVFQDPQGSLDPRMSVLDLVAEPIRAHLRPARGSIEPAVLELLDGVGLARRHLDRRPHELSGGQCQRVAIARALALRPRLLVLDEPTSALDVSVQAQILNLLLELRARHGLTYLLISHDLGVVRHLSDRVSVMYLGRIVEHTAAEAVFDGAEHPYTRALLASVPDVAGMEAPRRALITGDPPSPADPPPGCTFHPRCWLRARIADGAICASTTPPPVGPSNQAACWFTDRVGPAIVSLAAEAAAEEAEIMAPGAKPPEGSLVTPANWQDPPYLRWAYVHIGEILPTAAISRGDAPVTSLSRAERSLDDVRFRIRGVEHTVGEMLARTDTDGFLVIHRGRIVTEWYGGAMTDTTPHLLQSVSKSMTSALVGALAGAGLVDPSAEVTRYVEELRGGAFEGCTVQHLLDMRAGTRFSEAYEDLDADIRISEQVAGWRPRTRPDLPQDLHMYMAGLANHTSHGGTFEYRSILTDVLGWVLERAGGDSFARLYSQYVWSRIGAERDASITVDASGCALTDGGISVTLRDLGRFGLMYLGHGAIEGRQVVPASWVGRVGVPRPDLVEAFGGSLSYDGVATPSSHYHDQWWVFDADRGVFGGIGIHGQALVIHRPAEAVIVKLSTHADALDREKHELALAGAMAIGSALEREA
jgi:oligopeptide/dipeptide ABC transporter ATP-binding protein